LLVVCEG